MKTIAFALGGMVLLTALLVADDGGYLGQWEGMKVRVLLNVQANGRVTGSVSSQETHELSAMLTGRRISETEMEVDLHYRFESYGKLRLRRTVQDGHAIWADPKRKFWFGRKE